jgi:prolyl oligopeptidase
MYLMISSLLPNIYRSKIYVINFAIRGGSNGLLVGATMTQRPRINGLPAVGVMDMLRYHTFTALEQVGL